jgi:7-cyano-7-deazaguanine synthase
VKKKNAIVLISGGIDSCLVAADVTQKYNTAFLHVNYGHRTEKRDQKSFKDIANFFKVKKRLVADLKFFKEIGGSSLTDKKMNVTKAGTTTPKKVPTSYVPFKNAHFISIAASWAEVIEADKIFIGCSKEVALMYPDSTARFLATAKKMLEETSSRKDLKIALEFPLINKEKSQIISEGEVLKIPFHLTWSCYKNNDIACGECEGCVRRLGGFKKAGLFDPLEYMVY